MLDSGHRFGLFFTISALLHCSAVLVFYYYGPQLKETAENLVPVEVMVIEDKPLVSIRSLMETLIPKTLSHPWPPLKTSGMSTKIKTDFELADHPSDPILTKQRVRLNPPSYKKPETKVATSERTTKVAQSSSLATSIQVMAPEDQPAITLRPANGLIAVSTTTHSVPVPDLKTAIPQKRDINAGARAYLYLEKVARYEPVMMVQESEPEPLIIEQPLTSLFPGSAQGASFILLVDTSGSVKGNPIQGIKASAIEFVSLMGAKDRVGLMTLNDRADMINELTSKNSGLKDTLSTLQTAGRLTVLYDALLEAAQLLKEEQNENLHIVLFSDGKDEGSQAGLEQVIETLGQSNVSVLAVGFTRVEEKHLDILRKIADDTGGAFVQTPEFRDILSLYKTTSPATKAAPYGLTANQGALLVKSDPTDADVYVDGKFIGRTPMLIELPMGTFNLLLRNQCCYDWQAAIEIAEPGEMPLFIKMENLSE